MHFCLVCVCVCVFENSPVKEGGRQLVHCSKNDFFHVVFFLGRLFLCDIQHPMKVYSYIMHWNVLLLPVNGFLFAGRQGIPQSDPCTVAGFGSLNSWPVTGYREGGATSIWSPAQSGDYIVLHVGLHVGYVNDHCPLTVSLWASPYQNRGMGSF